MHLCMFLGMGGCMAWNVVGGCGHESVRVNLFICFVHENERVYRCIIGCIATRIVLQEPRCSLEND